VAYEGFVPQIPPLHQPFWDSVKRHRAELQRCDRCGRFRFIPSERCPCGSREFTWTPIAGTGDVYTYTVVHRAPTPAYQAQAPYVIAHVTLVEGPRLISTVVGCDPGAVSVGMPVELVYDDVTPELTLYRFQPMSTGP
jgi:uncharacterized OB-fold protein